MKPHKRIHITVLIILAAALIIAVAAASGLFSYKGKNLAGDAENNSTGGNLTTVNSEEPVKYYHTSRLINGLKQEINVLEADISNNDVQILPVLSHDLVYGFEKLSEISSRSGAYAAVNAGFFSKYGEPSGLVAAKGQIITASSSAYPVFSCANGKAALSEIKSQMWIISGSSKMPVNRLNSPGKPGETAVYTKVYGSTNRVGMKNRTIIVRNGIIEKNILSEGETRIPEDGFIITFFGGSEAGKGFIEGSNAEFVHDPYPVALGNAYQCGCWIVRDSVAVIGASDPWIGVTTNRDPRTVIGLKGEHTVVLLTVDGRQPGYSAGLTGKELAELLLELGVKDAAMLDGGASTEMIYKGRLVNKPSFKGEERPLGGGIIIEYPAASK